MCYSGRCEWESHEGDCMFPTINVVEIKYKYPLCVADGDATDAERKWLIEANKDVRKLVEEDKKNNTLII